MSQTNTDILYIEDDYFTPDGYYTYTALAASAQSSSFTLSAIIGNVKGADLVANNFASVSATASVIKGVASSISSSVTQTTSANRTREFLSPYAYTWADVVEWDNYPNGVWTTNDILFVANSSFSAELTKVAIEAQASLSSAFTQSCGVIKTASMQSTQTSAFTQSGNASKITDFLDPYAYTWDNVAEWNNFPNGVWTLNGVLFVSQSTITANLGQLHTGAAALASAVTQTTTSLRIIDFAVTLAGAFSPTMTASAIRNSFAVLDSVASMSVDATANRAVNIALASAISQSLSGMRLAGLASTPSAQFTQTSAVNRSASLQATISGAFTPSISINEIQSVSATLSSAFTLTAIGLRPSRSSIITATATPRYTDVGFSTSTKKFGTASLYADSTSGSTEIRPRSNAVWDGSNFKTFENGYTWTSSDGITWTRASNNLSSLANGLGNYSKVKYLNSNWIFVSGGLIYYSSNGTTWSSHDPAVGGGYTFENINYYSGNFYISGGGGRFVVYRSTTITGTYTVGYQSGVISDYSQSTDLILNASGLAVAYSRYNGSTYSNFLVYGSVSTWSVGTIDTGVSVAASLLAHDGTTYAVSFNGTSTTIKKSTTGATSSWSTSSASVNTQPVGLAYKNSKWIVTSNNIVYAGTTIDNVASVLTNNFSTQYDNISSIEYGDNKWLYIKNGSALYSSNTTSWSEDDIEDVVNMPGYVDAVLGDNTDNSQFGTMDFWINNPGSASSRILTKVNSDASANGYIANLSSNTFTFIVFNGSTFSGSVNTGWNHVRISSSGGTMSLYIDGTRVSTASSSLASTTGQLRFFGQASTGTVYIDEFLITDQVLTAPSATSFTVPTGEFANTADTDLLLHFNGNLEDSSEIPKVYSMAASLASAASVSATVIKQAQANAAISSSVTQTANANRLRDVTSNQSSAFTLTATAIEVPEEGVVNLTSQFALSATTGFQVNSGAMINVVFGALTANTNAILTNSSTMSSPASLVAGANVIPGIEIAANSTATLTAIVRRLRGVTSTLAAVSTVSVTGKLTRDYSAGLTSSASMVTANSRTRTTAIQTDALFTELAAIVKIGQGLIHMDVVVSTTASAIKTASVSANISAVSTLSISTQVNKPFAASVSSAFTQTAAATKAIVASAGLSSAVTTTATATRLRGVVSAPSAVATVTASAQAIKGTSAGLTSAFTQTATAGRNRSVSANLTVVATVTPIPTSLVLFNVTITGAFNAVMAFDIIHIDPYLTWKIQAENRTYKIQEENREYIIKG
jgi:hypothetical protein